MHATTPTAQANVAAGQTNHKKGLTPRSLINVGIYTALYFVVVFASGMLGMLSPAFSVVGYIVGILINGTVIMLYMVKTPAFGAMTLLSAILSLLFVSTGHFWGTIPIAIVCGLIADFVIASGQYRSKWRNILAFGVFQLWMIGPFLPMFYDRTGYSDYVASSMGQEYAEAWMSLFTPLNLVLILALLFVVALVAAWIGTRILERNFAKAGIL
ncbi:MULTISPECIES: MptD family putative ECF transporter S component [unclassified Pseudoclavibacter]|uniref:MptD family putative ECF transporter S component n=1 Tax=unclassified Pseudoclavibacter TaxID=2615177 RepID=UPI001301092E|nr:MULTISPECIES: MptD family putative ECF transporter S component [unclassified Pseudoclavibacter]KAB1657685.1 MptD family putative ECF transporter S component [Pseudoclavibacter sp. CFCC 11306]KAB1660447.1 MptD family putative ECF transporter S component [Pseudoclavibacter sp. CFCC 13796]